MESLPFIKEQQRKNTLQRWKLIMNRKFIEHSIHTKLMQTDVWDQAQTIGVTISKGLEWDTEYLINKAWQQGKRIVIPKSNPHNNSMAFYQYQAGDELENVWTDIWEPSISDALCIEKNQIDLMIVPGVVFNKQGFRIGYGGGFYDRYLQCYTGATVSLAADFQIVETIIPETHDKPVDILISNFGKIYCNHT
ncbi:5-formyltetrahydrofolate cyclo-ligase [Gracilibacillus orientalis]|uniref:5-formyltetrahydrofolate cyclo-ligase n=1 Tax=Gracilibacillus orientalis TaxID=334253 RepID=A0A1I4KU23_9BACI|nr:5-formyltetrahydrofolate cyclo-ligase [Gracilibacillus orientalis]SFL82136.1 5-formyltetrahydrofolate cyclo-ligase [Gracilibacillus orientalis]